MKWLLIEAAGWLGIGAFAMLFALWLTGGLHAWG